MPGPRAVQNLQMPQPWDWQGGQMPRSSRGQGGGGGGWAQLELTDALFHRSYRYRLSKAKGGGLFGLWSEWEKLFYREKKTVG